MRRARRAAPAARSRPAGTERGGAAVGALTVVSVLVVVATLAGWAGRFAWWGDTLAVVFPLLAVVALASAGTWWALGRRRVAALGLATTLLATAPLVPWIPWRDLAGRAASAPSAAPAELVVYIHNVHFENRAVDALLAQIDAADPDLVFLMEYPNAIRAELEAGLEAYPHRLVEPSVRTMGVALFSRIPFDAEVRRAGEERIRIPIVEADFEVGGAPVRFVGAHPWPPIGPRWGPLHREQMTELARVAAPPPGDADPALRIVAGDLNTAPWSWVFSMLERRTGTRDVRRGRGAEPTWWGAPGVGLPIDHVLVSPGWRVRSVRRVGRAGSDHTALRVALEPARPAAEPQPRRNTR